MTGALLLPVLLIVAYPMAPTLLIASAIRFTFRWSASRKRIALAGLLALPQSVMTLFVNFLSPPATRANQIALYSIVGLAVIALIVWASAVFRPGVKHFWLEPALLIAVSAAQIYSIDNWIAH